MFSLFQIATFCLLILFNFFFKNSYESFLVCFFFFLFYILFLFITKYHLTYFFNFLCQSEIFIFLMFTKTYNTFLQKNKKSIIFNSLFSLKENERYLKKKLLVSKKKI